MTEEPPQPLPLAADAAMRPDAGSGSGGRSRTSLAVSLGLHAGLLTLLALLVPLPPAHTVRERSVNVEILDSRQFDAAFAPPKATPVVPPPDSPVVPAPEIRPGGMTVVKSFLSAKVLDDPRSADAKAALPMMVSDERIVQLCNIEALAQVSAADPSLQPDIIIPYAMRDVRVSASSVDAPGGAFRSNDHWFNLRFKCGVTGDLAQVAAFEFRIGDEIPVAEWEDHHLFAGEDEDDD